MNIPGPGGFSASGYFRDSHVLYKLNLQTGEFEELLPYENENYSYEFSPDQRLLAYSPNSEKNIVHILDLASGRESKVALDSAYTLTGAFAWQTDGSKLIFASALEGWENGQAGFSIFKLTLKNLHIQPILVNDKRLLVPYPDWETGTPKVWSDDHLLFLTSLAYESEAYWTRLALDINSGAIAVLATPDPRFLSTPTPTP